MRERKIPIDLDCGINIYTLVAGGKWKACILSCISKNIKRPTDIHKEMNYATPRVLNMQLKELLKNGIIEKKIFPGLPLKVEYELTGLGLSLLPVIDAMDKWGAAHREIIPEASLQFSSAEV